MNINDQVVQGGAATVAAIITFVVKALVTNTNKKIEMIEDRRKQSEERIIAEIREMKLQMSRDIMEMKLENERIYNRATKPPLPISLS